MDSMSEGPEEKSSFCIADKKQSDNLLKKPLFWFLSIRFSYSNNSSKQNRLQAVLNKDSSLIPPLKEWAFSSYMVIENINSQKKGVL